MFQAATFKNFPMLGDASGDAFAPKAKAGRLNGTAHVINHLCFGEAGAFTDFVEGGAIVPGHSDEGIGSFGG